MTDRVKGLLLLVSVLAVTQWLVVPVLAWQSDAVSALERGIATLAARSQLIEQMPAMEREFTARNEAISKVSERGFTAGATDTLEVQRWIVTSLKASDLLVESFEWRPKTGGDPATAQARLEIRGRADDVFYWIGASQLEQPWLKIVSMQLASNTRRGRNSGVFGGQVTVQVLLRGDGNAI